MAAKHRLRRRPNGVHRGPRYLIPLTQRRLRTVGVLSCHCRCGTLNLLGSRQVGALEYGHWLAPVDAESLSPRIILPARPDGFPSHSLQRLSGSVICKAVMTSPSELIVEKSGTSAKPMTWKEGFQSTVAVYETLNGSRHGRQLERASQKRRITAFEIWNLIRLPSTAQKETAGEAAPVRPHAHLKHVRGGSGGARILDNACGGKVLRSPSTIGFFRGCEPDREFGNRPLRATGPPG